MASVYYCVVPHVSERKQKKTDGEVEVGYDNNFVQEGGCGS